MSSLSVRLMGVEVVPKMLMFHTPKSGSGQSATCTEFW